MVYDLCKGGTGRMALFNLSIIQFLLQVRHAGEFTCNHCFCCIFSITSTKTTASSLLIFTLGQKTVVSVLFTLKNNQ